MRIPPALVRMAGEPLVSLLAASWRREARAEARWRAVVERGEPYLFVLWHEALLPLLWHHRRQGIAIVVSGNRDGQYLAGYAERIGYRQLTGSSSSGGVRALLGAVKELQAGGVVAFTPDGPRGPRREVKPGVAVAAQRGGGTIVPLHAEADRAWRLRSWDRFMIPKPFARVRISYGEPFRVEAGEDGVARAVERVTGALNTLVDEAGWHDAATDIG